MPIDTHRELAEDLKHCPENLPGNPGQRVNQARIDVRNLLTDVRELDPGQVWGRLARWTQENPARVYAAMIELASRIDPDTTAIRDSPEWTHAIGGMQALHPDHGVDRSPTARKTSIPRHSKTDEIIALRKAGLAYPEIARRTGASENTVFKACKRAGLTEKQKPNPERDAEIMRLTAQNVTIPVIAHKLGIHARTVERAQARARAQVDTDRQAAA